jgi:hypothetical protein
LTTRTRRATARGGTRLTPAQRNAFLGSFGGWAMDGYNWTIFGLVLAPTMAVLLPASGIADTPSNVGYYGQISSAIFLAGWGASRSPRSRRGNSGFEAEEEAPLPLFCYGV